MSADTAVIAGRAAAESLMVDSCTITKPGATPAWDEESGRFDAPTGATLYSGRCRVQTRDVAEHQVNAGERPWMTQETVVQLPLTADGYAQENGQQVRIPVGAAVTLTALGPTSDPDLLGARFTVRGFAKKKTHPTRRDLRCEEVTG